MAHLQQVQFMWYEHFWQVSVYIYRITSNERRGKKDNFTPNREIMIYICFDLGNSYVSTEFNNVSIHRCN